jgi:two-component system, cell cycle sensor histidine kinase and response regulator CckA
MIGEVLIVDDTPANLQVLSDILRDEGLSVRLAPSGVFALRSVQVRHPDLILLDIRMPEMDGFAVCQRLREDPATAHIPVLFLSASQEPDERLEAFNVGGLDFIPKPFFASEVLARVSAHLSIARLRCDLAKANLQLSSQVVDEQHQRRQAENIAEDRQVRLEMALNAAGMGTWIADGPDGQMQFDQQAQQLLALEEAHLSGGWRSLVNGFAPANRSELTTIWQRALAQHQTFDFEGWWMLSDERRRIRIRGCLDADESLGTKRIVGLVWDVTADHQMRARLVHSEKMESLGQLAGGLAHDFNNHLTVILGNLDLLHMHVGAEAKTLQRLTNINQAALTATGLVRDLMTFARRRELAMSTISLSNSISELKSLLKSLLTSRITLTIDTPMPEVTVIGNREQLQNAVMNLCVNARDAMPTAGSLRIGVSLDHVRGAVCRVCAHEVSGTFAVITVSDNGDGIPLDLQDRIFEPFFTTKAEGKGTGLGLAAVVGCVTAHHGHLLLDSTPGHGATFRILIPVTQALAKNIT